MPIQAELDDKQTVCEPDQSLFFFILFFFFRLDRMKEKCIYLCYRQMKTADVTRMLITFLQDK